MALPQDAQAVLAFWFQECQPSQWFVRDPALDAVIARRFGALHGQAAEGALARWGESARGALAEILVLDQFSRNIYRDDPRAFAADSLARERLAAALDSKLDRALDRDGRMFLYMPLMHSETLADQEQSVRLFRDLGLADALDYAERHREIIVRFGRFPHRNAVLGRRSGPEETAFLQQPGSSF